MKKSRAIIFNIVFQIAVTLLILDFKFNPLLLSSTCLTGIFLSLSSPCGLRAGRIGKYSGLHRLS